MNSKITVILIFCLFTTPSVSNAFVKSISKGYCNVTHPVEMFAPIRYNNTSEDQHIIQKQSGGLDWENISVIPASSHIATDTWAGDGVWGQNRVWDTKYVEDRPGGTGDSENALEQAYKLGRYQLEYAFCLYNYNGDKFSSTLAQWDGMSHLLYAVTWWVNLPSKYLRKLAYLIDKDRYALIIDHVIQLPILIIEGAIGFIYGLLGVFFGICLQPLDTILSLIPGAVLLVKSTFGGIIDVFLTAFGVVKACA